MAKKIKNERCPLQRECGRSCEHVGAELKCDYYRNNGIGDNTIPDQEELRKQIERLKDNEDFEAEIAALPDEEEKTPTAENRLVYLPISELYPHPDNPRKDLGDLTELADSIKAKGVMQNLTVVKGHYLTVEEYIAMCKAEGVTKEVAKNMYSRENAYVDDGYTVIIGHRRMGASKLAGLKELPCVIVEMSAKDQVATMLLENMQRSDLTVFEQAQGFQMMFDFGESVESIAEKTGFSKSTVRRRLKMAELDQNTLKEVSARQLSLEDFDRLSQIDDIDQRNECLKEIGTANFNQTINNKLKKQNIAKKLPLVKEYVKKLHARKITRSETYGGKYESVDTNIRFHEWDPETPLVDFKEDDPRKLFYCIDEDWGTIGFYVERPKAKPQKRPQAEIDREKYIAETRAQLTELAADLYKLRSDFIKNFNGTSKNIADLLQGAVIASTLHVITWVRTDSTSIYDALGVENAGYSDAKYEKTLEAIKAQGVKVYPRIVYAAFGDAADSTYFTGYNYEFPKHETNLKLNALYEWLTLLGYEMSDDEKQLRDGTHPLFIDKDKPAEEVDDTVDDVVDGAVDEEDVDKDLDAETTDKIMEQLREMYGADE
ncbi:MAG: ParB/RepB/Spo0J family partition protein [Clostridia bacterium]|nr:ParB/RepB/Spo0J family partition protein [Clostridia bacterium]